MCPWCFCPSAAHTSFPPSQVLYRHEDRRSPTCTSKTAAKLEVAEWGNGRSKPRPGKHPIDKVPRCGFKWGFSMSGQLWPGSKSVCWGQATELDNGDQGSRCTAQVAPWAQLKVLEELICTQFTVTWGASRPSSEKYLLFRPANLLWCCNILPPRQRERGLTQKHQMTYSTSRIICKAWFVIHR